MTSRSKRMVSAMMALPLALMLQLAAGGRAGAETELPVIHLYKSPTCGCCTKWAERARASGFRVEITDTEELELVKKLAGIPGPLQACHTASVDGYAVEGHVPLDAVKAMLKTRPRIRGISVPGMPAGSPGMETGGKGEAFQVISFGGGQPERVFRSYPAR